MADVIDQLNRSSEFLVQLSLEIQGHHVQIAAHPNYPPAFSADVVRKLNYIYNGVIEMEGFFLGISEKIQNLIAYNPHLIHDGLGDIVFPALLDSLYKLLQLLTKYRDVLITIEKSLNRQV